MGAFKEEEWPIDPRLDENHNWVCKAKSTQINFKMNDACAKLQYSIEFSADGNSIFNYTQSINTTCERLI
jgi:hypothetical protein